MLGDQRSRTCWARRYCVTRRSCLSHHSSRVIAPQARTALVCPGAGLRWRTIVETDQVADAERWYDPGEVRPRELVMLPRCTCQSGGMFHPAHPWGP